MCGLSWLKMQYLRGSNTAKSLSKYCALILHTEGWLHFKDNNEFVDEALEELYAFYGKPFTFHQMSICIVL